MTEIEKLEYRLNKLKIRYNLVKNSRAKQDKIEATKLLQDITGLQIKLNQMRIKSTDKVNSFSWST